MDKAGCADKGLHAGQAMYLRAKTPEIRPATPYISYLYGQTKPDQRLATIDLMQTFGKNGWKKRLCCTPGVHPPPPRMHLTVSRALREII